MIKHKFHAKPCESSDGKKFQSKLEAAVYFILKNLQQKKEILFFLRQVPFDLPGNIKHRIDYCIFTKDDVKFVEVKGFDHTVGLLKRKQVEALYPVSILVLKKAEQIYEMVSPRG